MEKSDSFDRRRAVLESVVEVFKAFRIDRKNFEGKQYILWIETKGENKDEVFVDLTMKNANGLTLNEEIIDFLFRKGYEIDSIELRHGTPENNLDRIKKKEAANVVMYLEEVSILGTSQTPTIVLKARLTLAPGSPAALKQPEGYEIDNKHAPYNIGRVIEPDDPINRVNEIEIVDDTFTVSRTQAHIGFSNELGYYIQREKGDYIRTKVIRKGDPTPEHKLASEYVLFPLLDSDIIELNGYVRLLFQVID